MVESIKTQLEMSRWYDGKAAELIVKFNNTKDVKQREKLNKQLQYMKGKLLSELRNLERLIEE